MTRPIAVLSGLILSISALLSASQTPTPQFRSTTDLVVLDVSVLDKQRKAVRGLKAEDFTILEDGKPQTIATFSAVDLPNPEAPTAKWMSRTPRDVQTNRMPGGRLVLLYIDERQPSADPFASKATLEVSHAIVDQLSPDDVMAVGFAFDHRGAQEFTTDRGRLHAAVDTYSPQQPAPFSVLGTLRDLANLLGAIPERRKILIYVGPGQSYDQEVMTTMEKVTGTGAAQDPFARPEQQTQYNNLLSLFSVAQRANVSIYTVDPAGLDTRDPSAPNKEFLRLIASNTGARAVIGNNVPASQVPIIMSENAAYYLMAFRSTNQNNDGKFRKLDIKVNRPGVEVRTRRGYVEGRPGPTFVQSANPALNRLIPATQLGLGLWAEPASSDAGGSHPVAMIVDVTLPREGAPPSEHIAVNYSIADMSGKERASGRRDLTVRPPAGSDPTYTAEVSAVANLPPGRYDIRLSAQSVERNRRGGMLGDVIVPDFAKDPLSLSGLFIGAPDSGGARADEVSAVVGLAPTTDREFATGDAVTAALRVYQAKQPLQPVTLKVSILDAHDKPAFETVEKLPVEAFAAGAASYRLAMPFSKLGQGAYMLRIEASRPGAQPVKRETMFQVR